MEKTNELKPCPYCGSKPVTHDFYMRGHKIACENLQCPIRPETIWYGYFDLAEKAWNTRAEMP
jgi:NAD-dependent SIR2 family protein deacetylase